MAWADVKSDALSQVTGTDAGARVHDERGGREALREGADRKDHPEVAAKQKQVEGFRQQFADEVARAISGRSGCASELPYSKPRTAASESSESMISNSGWPGATWFSGT